MKNISVYQNGVLVQDELLIHRLIKSKVGIFETLRVYEEKIFRLDEHLLRLQESAKTTGFDLLPPITVLKRDVRKALKAYLKDSGSTQSLILRLSFFDQTPYILIFEKKHNPSIYLEGVSLRTSPVKRSPSNASFPEAKSAAYQNGLMAQLEPKSKEIYEWLFLDSEGYVNEVTVGNLFVVTYVGSRPLLLTPPTQGILNGVTRQTVIECALHAGISTKERMLTRHEIYNASEAFLTNTSWEILSICKLDQRKIGQDLPGKITKQLQKQFQKIIKEECL